MRLSMPTEKHAIGASTKRSRYNPPPFDSNAFSCTGSFDALCIALPDCFDRFRKTKPITRLRHVFRQLLRRRPSRKGANLLQRLTPATIQEAGKTCELAREHRN